MADPIPRSLDILNSSYGDFVAIFLAHSDNSVHGQYSCPTKVVELQTIVSNLENLPVISFLNYYIIDQLELELPKYLAAAESISPTQDPHVWWIKQKDKKEHASDLPHLSTVYQIQSSSAAVESVFFPSLLNSFTEPQMLLIENYIESLIIINCNAGDW